MNKTPPRVLTLYLSVKSISIVCLEAGEAVYYACTPLPPTPFKRLSEIIRTLSTATRNLRPTAIVLAGDGTRTIFGRFLLRMVIKEMRTLLANRDPSVRIVRHQRSIAQRFSGSDQVSEIMRQMRGLRPRARKELAKAVAVALANQNS